MKKYDIGIIGAMSAEVDKLISLLENHERELVSGIEFNTGVIYDKNVVIARCGIGKVFAAICAEAMILRYMPTLVVNTGVGGAVSSSLRPLDIVFATRLCQHDMDTSPLGDPKGLISGINKVYFDADKRALDVLTARATELGIRYTEGIVASGDRFIAAASDKENIRDSFGAVCCEMEGAAIAQVAYVNNTPFMVVRAISDSANGDAEMDYMTFLPKAAELSTALTLALIWGY